MKAQISLKVLDTSYDQKYADQYQQGNESIDNWKYEWEKAYELNDVSSFEYIDNSIYSLKLKNGLGETKQIPIPNVSIFRFHFLSGETIDYGVSKSLLNKHHVAKNDKYDVVRCYFYINSEPERINLADQFIIDAKDCPSLILEGID
jgi:hypothetical protein